MSLFSKFACLAFLALRLSAQTATVIGVCPGASPQITGPVVFGTANGQPCLQPPAAVVSTPHFGNDGSQMTRYVPGKSMFVRSMFFNDVNLPTYAAAFKAAGINTVETGFYPAPNTTPYTTEPAWQQAFDASHASVNQAISYGFNLLFTGDAIARGSAAAYDACCGPSAAWIPNPLTYAFTWLRSLGKTIGVEMVDEISSQFAAPFPQGQLGQPGGPTQITCVSNVCTVAWPSPLNIVWENGALGFLITGSTSNANLNRSVPNWYKQNAQFSLSSNHATDGFTFNATGVGTQTFTAATDPNLTIQIFATIAEPEGTPGATDYVHNNVISQIMANINAASGRPSVTWPAAAAAPAGNFGAWAGPGASDYGDLYFAYLGGSGPNGAALPSDGLKAFSTAWNAKASHAQQGRPLLMETGDYGISYGIAGVPDAVASFDGNTLVLLTPHGIAAPIIRITRLTLSGDTNAALNGNYYVYAVPSTTSLKVYPASPSGASVQGGTVTFADGQSVNLATFPTLGSLSPSSMQMNGGAFCLHPANFGQAAVVTASPTAAYNGARYVLPGSFNNLESTGCAWNIKLSLLTPGQVGTGGTAALIPDNYYHPGVSPLGSPGTSPDLIAANIMYAAEKGAAGVRVYMFGDDANANAALSSCFTGCNLNGGGGQNTHVDPNPLFNGPIALAAWQGLSNAFNLIAVLEPLLLEPQLPAPNYGATMVTAARSSSYGNLLLMTEFANTPQAVTVDLSAYNRLGGSGTMYTMTGEQSIQQTVSGTSIQVTFAPAETVAFAFPAP